MGTTKARRWTILTLAALLAAQVSGCRSESAAPDPALASLVGAWDASVLRLTSVANPQVVVDLVGLGAAFRLDIQPSGQYTAILVYGQQTSTEIGTLSVAGNTLTMRREFPSLSTSAAVFTLAGNRLTLDGDSEFDFNFDGAPEPALAHFELVRR